MFVVKVEVGRHECGQAVLLEDDGLTRLSRALYRVGELAACAVTLAQNARLLWSLATESPSPPPPPPPVAKPPLRVV